MIGSWTASVSSVALQWPLGYPVPLDHGPGLCREPGLSQPCMAGAFWRWHEGSLEHHAPQAEGEEADLMPFQGHQPFKVP